MHQTTVHVRLRLLVCSALNPIQCLQIDGVNRKCCSVQEIIELLPRTPPGQDCEMCIVCCLLQVVSLGVWFGVSRYDKKSYIARCHIGFARRRQPPDVHSRPSSSVARGLEHTPPSLAGRLPPWTWALTGSNAWYTMFGLFVCFLHVGVCVCKLACAILQEGNEEQLYVLSHFIW